VKSAKRAAAGAAPAPDFLCASDLAARLGVSDVKTLDGWIASGRFPPPWAWLGPRKRVWRADHYATFCESGAWPDEAFKGGRS
jgi:hypothetical protein